MTVYSNMGAQLTAVGCGFAHEEYSVFNKLCEPTFIGCYFDSVLKGYILDDVTSGGGLTVSQLEFQNCRFEAGGNASYPLFKNSGRMSFKDCQITGTFAYQYFFENSGDIYIDGGFTRQEMDLYSSVNTATASISILSFAPVSTSSSGWRFTPKESGVFNGDIETGTTAGFVQVAGTSLAASTAITPHEGTYSLRMQGGTPTNVMESYPIKIKGDSKQFLLNVYFQNRSAVTVSPTVKFYDAVGNELSSTSESLSGSVSTWTRKRFFANLPNSTSYAKFYLSLDATVTNYVYMDDFYVNQW
jgi:hypothetical protein